MAAFFVEMVIYGGGKTNGDMPERGRPVRINSAETPVRAPSNGPAMAYPVAATGYAAFTNLAFSSIWVSPTNVALGIGWNALTNTAEVLDIYAKTNLAERLWRHLAEMDVDASDGAAVAELPLPWLV